LRIADSIPERPLRHPIRNPKSPIRNQKDVPLACISRRGKFVFLPLNATPQTEDLFLRYL
jgi:hypothetical protein